LDIEDIGRQVRASRRALKLAQPELGVRAEVSRQTIDRLENGRAGEIGYPSLLRILHAVGLDLRLAPLSQRRPTLDDLAREAGEGP
jgi:transcriptional regulator with XRE-family HTH domain